MEMLWITISLIFFMKGFGETERSKYIQSDLSFTFTLYTRNNSNGVRLIPGDTAQLAAVGFNGSLGIKLMAHGYLNNENSTWINRVKEEVFQIEEANIIIFDWSSCAKKVLYLEVVRCANVTSSHLGNFLKFLEKYGNLDLQKTHLIGHSLGAQLLGNAVSVYPPKTIGRITGLDPAGPLFESADPKERLNPDRAKIVDVIHTCIYLIGMKKPVGTLDFYPNGGFHHPACGFFDLGCRHRQSEEYFIDSFKNRNKYVARKCRTLKQALQQKCTGRQGTMGYFIGNSPPGIYHLKVS